MTSIGKETPFGAEYAKSGRAGCKGCKTTIAQGSLRMSVRLPSRFFDGLQDNWYHSRCFWKKVKAGEVNEASIRGMEWLKWEDQEAIRTQIGGLPSGEGEGNTSSSTTPTPKPPLLDRAKTSGGKCSSCKKKVEKGQLRIQYRGARYHPVCLRQLKLLEGGAGDQMSLPSDLTEEERVTLAGLFPPAAAAAMSGEGPPPAKKAKQEEVKGDSTIREQLKVGSHISATFIIKWPSFKKQSEVLWKVRALLSDNLCKGDLDVLLEANNRLQAKKKRGVDRVLDELVDGAVFGVPAPCHKCGGLLRYTATSHTYQCSGFISEYTRCTHSERNPARSPFTIPGSVKEALAGLTQALQLPERIYPAAGAEEALITAPKSFHHLSGAKRVRGERSSLSRGRALVKGGCTVDPDAVKCEVMHVYIDPTTKRPYQATLRDTDLLTGRNSFYKLQLLEHDTKKKYYLFRSWGRIGTSIGGNKTESYGADAEGAVAHFSALFRDKTRNEWDSGMAAFRKHPQGMDILEIDCTPTARESSTAAPQKLDVEASRSQLPRPIKELISMIFDVATLKSALVDYQIDLEKLPLGKLSKNHILGAYRVLTELAELVGEGEPDLDRVLDASNRFYTLIPTNTGHSMPPLLNNPDIIKSKIEMLDGLLEIAAAYSIIEEEKAEAAADGSTSTDPIDVHYQKLHCRMEVLEHKSAEFALIKKYLENTHGATHSSYTLEIVDVLRLEREHEGERFKKEIGNLQLLWHGSRKSNFVGILSRGLRIAPPEAPVTGYMFGKGVYLADTVSKSANYCHASPNSDGLLLLCEVALGEIDERKRSNSNIRKPSKGKHSVKGIGGTFPDPAEAVVTEEGMTVPCGKPINSDQKGLELLYNEYIVYDEAQVRLKYLVRAKFNYKIAI